MKLGMPTLIELPDIEDCAKLCNELGLQFVEFNMCLPQYQIENINAQKLIDIAQKYDIFYTIHLDDTNTPCDFNPKIAKAYTDTVIETIELAKNIGAPLLNMHLTLGTYFTLPERKVLLFEEHKDVYLQNLTAFRDKCEKAIGDSGIKIAVENTRSFAHPLGQETLDVLLESSTFAVTFDTGHDASNNFTQRPVIDKHIDRLVHMHLHDASPELRKDHLPFGDGVLNLTDYLQLAMAHNCRVVVEVKTIDGLKKSAEWLKRNLLCSD